MMGRVRKINPTSRRWITVVIYGILAAVIWKMIEPWAFKLLSPISQQLASWPNYLGSLSLILLGGTAAWLITKRQGVGIWGFLHFFRYPPLWVSILIGLCIVNYNKPDELGLSLVACIMWFALAMTLIETIPAIYRQSEAASRDNSNDKHAITPQLINNFEELKKWIQSDIEINTPKDDCFNHNAIASRIAKRLSTNPSDDSCSIGVIGPLGSGKTSIGKLVNYHLDSTLGIRFVQLSLWQYHTPEAAVSGILSHLINELGNDVDTLAMTRLPDAYIQAIAKSSTPLSSLTSILAIPQQPDELLEKIETIADAIGLKVILWIEDLERYAGSEQEEYSHELVRWQMEEKLDPLRSLLYLLDKQKNISVIVADTGLNSRFDLQKIVRFIEKVPSLSPDQVSLIGKTFHQGLLKEEPTLILPDNEKSIFTEEIAQPDWLSYLQAGENLATSPFSLLNQTPRTLKMTLRLTVDMWVKLRGEIDLDHLLSINLIRIVNPKLFSFVEKHIQRFQDGPYPENNRVQRGVETKEDAFLRKLEQLVGSPRNQKANQEVSTRSREMELAYQAILEFLFPRTYQKQSRDIRPQGIFHDIYWKRYIKEDATESEILDQRDILPVYENWISGDSLGARQYAKLVCNTKLSSRAVHFIYFTTYSLEHLAQLLKFVAEEEHRAPIPNTFSNAGLGLKALNLRAPSEYELWGGLNSEVQTAFEELIDHYTPIDLPLMKKIQDIFCINPGYQFNLTFGQKLVDCFPPENWSEFLDALGDNTENTLNEIILNFHDFNSPTSQEKFEPSIYATLLEALRNAPHRAIPHFLLLMVTNSKDPAPTLKIEFAKKLCSLEELQRMLHDDTLRFSETNLTMRLTAARKGVSEALQQS